MPLPVVLDTDIGTDIDDAYALLLAATAPELDLRAVTTVNNDVRTRARIARTLLRLLGRDEVRVAEGASQALTPGKTIGWMGHEGRGIDLSGVSEGDLAQEDAARTIALCAEGAAAQNQPLTLLPIGAMTNLAIAMDKYPQEMRHVTRIVAMASNFVGFGADVARHEHNVACDQTAVQRVLDSGTPLTFVGLNVTSKTRMAQDLVDEIAAIGGPLADALVGMHRVWFNAIKCAESPMHDPLAVVAAFRPEILRTEPAVARIDFTAARAGTVVFERPGPGSPANCEVATDVDADAFHALFRERILRAVEG